MSIIAQPETPARRGSVPRQRAPSNVEFYSWIFMRISGILLIGLVFTHIGIMHVLEGGVSRVNFAFVCGRWSGPFWQTWDWAQLFLATLHGANGMRIVMTDYIRSPQKRLAAKTLLSIAAGLMIILGTITILTFSPLDCAPPSA
jgi:succinate dehydrogenase / fumarate reductase membrane anchor subunit